jgi:hypothetical protein
VRLGRGRPELDGRAEVSGVLQGGGNCKCVERYSSSGRMWRLYSRTRHRPSTVRDANDSSKARHIGFVQD